LRGLAPIVGDLVKERLTGAIILVALIVLLVPELLTGPIKSAPRAVVTSAEEPPLRSYTINLGDDARAHSAAAQPQSAAPQPLAAAASAPAPAPPAPSQEAPAATAAAPGTSAAPPPAAMPAPAAPVASGEGGAALVVQLGSFASHANADRLAHQLKGQGFAASVSQGTSGRHLYRVRVGPVHDRAAAVQLQSKLKAAGHSGSVVPN
jgi:cell division septation protein DedD